MSARRILLYLICLSTLVCCQDAARKPDTISIAVPYELDVLDPHLKTRLSNRAITSNFYESLVMTDASNRIWPRLAVQWENPDMRTWTFHLQRNARFHDGQPLQAEDVVYTLRRLQDNPHLEIRTYLSDIEEFTAVDEGTVRIRTKTPLGMILNKLSHVAIIPRKATEEQLATNVNGTGPYRLVRWKQREMVYMERNEDYWGEKPEIKKVYYYLDRSPQLAVKDLVSGKCQLIQYDFKKLESAVQSLGNFQTLRKDNYFLKYLSYDVFRDETPYCSVKPNPFKNPLVRKAIHYGINRSSLIDELPTYAVTASQPVPPYVVGYNPLIRLPDYDPEKSRSLLREAGYPDGFQVTLFVRDILSETGKVIQGQLGQIGIDIVLKIMPDPEFFQALDQTDFTFFLSRIGATIGDASDVLEPQLHTRDPALGLGVRNWIHYSNPDVDLAIEQSAKILKLEDRREELEKAMSILMEDLPWIPLYIDQDVYALEKSFSWSPRHDSHIMAYEIRLRD